MPLPNITKFCRATCRKTGLPCKNAGAWGMPVCRYHGARKPETVRRGEDHPQFKSGDYSQETKAAYRAAAKRLQKLEAIGFNYGFMSGSRTRGRKPKFKAVTRLSKRIGARLIVPLPER